MADEGDIRVVEAKAESQFPDGIRFFITAESSGLIDEIRVFFRKADETGRSAYRAIDVEPGVSVSGESMLPAGTGGDYFPPGTKIHYSFEVRDKAGAIVRTDDQEFIYLDNRFEWRTRNRWPDYRLLLWRICGRKGRGGVGSGPSGDGTHAAGVGDRPHRAPENRQL